MRRVGVVIGTATSYPTAPFDPPEAFPELEGTLVQPSRLDVNNCVYRAVRESLARFLAIPEPYTREELLRGLRNISPGAKSILVKPNWVAHDPRNRSSLTTHGSVLRVVIDMMVAAFGPEVRIVVADIPIQSAKLDVVWRQTGVDALISHYRNVGANVEFADFRRELMEIDESGFQLARHQLPGDPRGYIKVDLGDKSWLEEITNPKAVFSVSDYEPGLASCHHQSGSHSYLISRTALEADLFINVPKLKTHHKAGFTCCMKNLVGVNGEKGWIPHFREGAPASGGDEYPDDVRVVMGLKKAVKRVLQGRSRLAFNFVKRVWLHLKSAEKTVGAGRLTDGGAWPGNDTIWRVVLDLVHVLESTDRTGKFSSDAHRKILCIVDGIVCGEGDGPLEAEPRPAGVAITSDNMIAADLVAAHIAGFDRAHLPQLLEARRVLERVEGRLLAECVGVSWSGDKALSPIEALPKINLLPPRLWRHQFDQGAKARDRADQVVG
ncbi:MAG: DUF362 domain-containing protein [Acidobacteriota bacterium]